MSFSLLETIQAIEQPPGDREEDHRDTEIEEIHGESPAFLNMDVPFVVSKRCQN